MRAAKTGNSGASLSHCRDGWLLGRRERMGGTSPSKVYANRERTTDFLLGLDSTFFNPQLAQVFLKLAGVFEDNSRHAKLPSRFGIGWDIVNIDGFLRSDLASTEGFLVDERIRFTCPHSKGIDARGKEPEKREACLNVGHVNRIGIGE